MAELTTGLIENTPVSGVFSINPVVNETIGSSPYIEISMTIKMNERIAYTSY